MRIVFILLFLTGCATFSERSCEADGFETAYKFKPHSDFPWVGKECALKNSK